MSEMWIGGCRSRGMICGVKRAARIMFDLVIVFSLLLFVTAIVMWIRSGWVIDVASYSSAKLHRLVSGGGGIIFESLELVHTEDNWRDALVTPVRTVQDFAGSRAAAGKPGGWAWEKRPYVNRDSLMSAAWGAGFDRTMPRIASLSVSRGQTFNNVTGAHWSNQLVGRRLWIPYWALVVLCVIGPLCRFIAWRRSKGRRRENVCVKCGYDLRATPDRCPECGTVPCKSHS